VVGVPGNQSRVGAVVAIVATVCGAIWIVGRPVLALVRKSPDTPEPSSVTKLDTYSFLKLQKHLKAELEAELLLAHADEQDRLRARIAELESRISHPETALKAAQTRISDLETLLERSGNYIGGDRITEARMALGRGDFSIADEIFAEIEARREMDVQEAARAAFGRGEIAEEQVRWTDAAEHYSRAARLDPKYETLAKAGEFLLRAGRQADAIQQGEQLVKIAKTEFGSEHEKTATAINNLASSYRATGRYDEAELLFREALAITGKTLGEAHPDYATDLNNLGSLLQATGRSDEAEPLYREALAVFETALGAEHPDTQLVRGNLERFLAKRPD
jgi:tetratricopeptide (TPR) repeat protein